MRGTWRRPAKDLVGIMIKLADEPGGWVSGRRVHKPLTDLDRRRLADGVALATEILGHFGAAPEDVVLGALNAGHPGGMLAPDPRQRRLIPRRPAARQRLRGRRHPAPRVARQPAAPHHRGHDETNRAAARQGG
jgi:hypothetical protein